MKPIIVDCIREIAKRTPEVSAATSEHLNELVDWIEKNWSDNEIYFEFMAANERNRLRGAFETVVRSSRWFALRKFCHKLIGY